MSFADFNDIYRICSNFDDDDGHSLDMVKLGIDMTPGSSVADLRQTGSYRWWEAAEKEIQQEKRETVLI
ncbi:hypothetical protein [Neobacillus cucumis]|uniref:Uncharacterized protein n=1 Tax=Neobacillus cucumis TaxID=1740721 RepID=A0A2N5HIL2_9BACI|nr:hypothetical protein [Neobacillus cucumis]PLS05362.1 hypothetical protein CVD27_10200 [Neobacillus cucumis]